MNTNINNYLAENFGIDRDITTAVNRAEESLEPQFRALKEIAEMNQYKVLKALQKNRISDMHFAWNTGYGYDDAGRAATEQVFADVFGAEAALVRTQIVNGTHALNLVFSGLMRPGDEMIYVTGAPYDSLQSGIGISEASKEKDMGSLREFGVKYNQVELTDDGHLDLDKIFLAITKDTKMICIQRATGYAWRRAISLDEIEAAATMIHEINPDLIVMTDNCYGEFLKPVEPTNLGVDIMAGSLIKNPGGGMALSGGYVAGRADLVEKISFRLTCPGIGTECGLTFGQTRQMLQGLFMAPSVVMGALKGAMLCARVFEDLGYEVCPTSVDERSDIIQAVKLESAEKLILFCEGIQQAAPVDSFVRPEPWAMPGYDDEIIMAAGAFVQGSSIELSADGPMREPYNVYFQGGLTYEYSKMGVMMAMKKLKDADLL
ncbi:MAG: methionine gamma-lyase family protein [Clostridiales Family XIII bacterium]|jgi:cystathionine beta-lyase family protein involved in aluminum resistance|nr:methionine gamma-lyase family protein [Clostridiales Family XIII bacterium]